MKNKTVEDEVLGSYLEILTNSSKLITKDLKDGKCNPWITWTANSKENWFYVLTKALIYYGNYKSARGMEKTVRAGELVINLTQPTRFINDDTIEDCPEDMNAWIQMVSNQHI